MALNWKSLAAIALMIIVVVPIGMGYVLASDTHEMTSYETSSTHNLSDYILNHRAPYYGDYTGSTNNHAIITEYLNQGNWYETINSPSYASVSDNPSSLPIETWTDHSHAAETGSDTYSESENFSIGSTIGEPFPTHFLDYYPTFDLTAPTYGPNAFDLRLQDPNGDVIYQGIPVGPVHARFSEPDFYWTFTFNDSTGAVVIDDVRGWMASAAGGFSMTVNWTFYTEITDLSSVPEYLISGVLYAGVGNGQISPWAAFYEASYIYVTEDTISVAGHDYPRSDYYPIVVAPLGSANIVYRTSSFSDTYGDPATGWTLPDIGSPQARIDYWSNNQENRGVTLYATLDVGEWFGLMPASQVSTSTDAALRVYRDADGMAIVDEGYGTEAHRLGNYGNVQVKIMKDSYVVTGIKAWPAMYGPVSQLNSVEISRAADTFTLLKLLEYNGSTVYWRVDNADINMGDYATTLDATLNLSEIFPDKSMALTMNSIAVYGDSLRVGSVEIPMENGRITVSGQTFPLRGSLWMWTLSDGAYTLTINGYHVDGLDSLASASLFYGGEWSTIITGYTVTPVTGVVTEWVPGGFAFDNTGMAAAAMISAIGAFVVLGLTGRASLPKAGILALVCGGAVAVFLLLT